MATFYVYEHWRTDRQECFYVGKGKARRAYTMANRNMHHRALQAKLSRDGFAIEVKIVESGLEEARAFELEVARILFWRSVGADLANFTDGGEGCSGRAPHNKGKKASASVRANIKRACGVRWAKPEERKKASERQKGKPGSMRGRKHSDETRKLFSEINKKRMQDPARRGRLAAARKGCEAPNKGVPVSPEQREKLRAAWVIRKIRPISPELREKGRVAANKRWNRVREVQGSGLL